MQVTSKASFSRTEVTLCARSAGVEVVVISFVFCSCQRLTARSSASSASLIAVPCRSHLVPCMWETVLDFVRQLHCILLFNSLSELCGTVALLCDGSRGERARQDRIKETRTWYNHAKYSFLIGRQCILLLSLNTFVCPI